MGFVLAADVFRGCDAHRTGKLADPAEEDRAHDYIACEHAGIAVQLHNRLSSAVFVIYGAESLFIKFQSDFRFLSAKHTEEELRIFLRVRPGRKSFFREGNIEDFRLRNTVQPVMPDLLPHR